MSKQDTPTPSATPHREDVVLTGSSAMDPEGRVAETYRANANLREGLMLVSYTNDRGTESAHILLDRDRDGNPDATFATDAEGASYFTRGDLPVMRFSKEDSRAMTNEIRNIIQYGGTDIGLYHQITTFLEHPTPGGLPHVVPTAQQQQR